MRMFLKAMGFWIWGLIAIGLSASLVTLSYRLASNHHWHDTLAILSSSETTEGKTANEPRKVLPPGAAKPKAGVISRVIGKEMRAAQSALRAGAWRGERRRSWRLEPGVLSAKGLYEFGRVGR